MKIDSPNAIGTSTGFGIPTGGTNNQLLVKTGSTNYATAWVSTINDQSSSNYIDIGEVRYQWGISPAGSNSRIITLPAAFKTTAYSFTATVSDVSDYASRTVNLDTKTTTTILVRVTTGGSGSGASFNWIAIGLKP